MSRDTDDGDNGGRPCDFLRRKGQYGTGKTGLRQLYPFEKDHGGSATRAFRQLYGASAAAPPLHGSGCGLFTFIPEKFAFIWILSSIPFYIYLFCSYMNYMLFYERVETALETESQQSI